jgi:cell division protein FtsL
MTVKSVNNAGQVYSAQQNLKKADQKADAAAAEERAAQQGDVLELSSEMKNLKSIQDKISAGLYNNDEVLRQVAINMMKDLASEA